MAPAMDDRRLHGADDGEDLTTGAVEDMLQILLRHHLKKLKLPTVPHRRCASGATRA